VAVDQWACPLRLRYATNVRRDGAGAEVEQAVRLLEAHIPDTKLEPWLLVTDWEVGDEASGVRIFRGGNLERLCPGACRPVNEL
jgi:hypothetical protein